MEHVDDVLQVDERGSKLWLMAGVLLSTIPIPFLALAHIVCLIDGYLCATEQLFQKSS